MAVSNPVRMILSVAVTAASLALAPMGAHARTFRDIEYGADDVAAADRALAVGLAPVGASVAAATSSLRKAGATPLHSAANGDLRFAYDTVEVTDDRLRDVRVLIRVSQDAGQVSAVSVDR